MNSIRKLMEIFQPKDRWHVLILFIASLLTAFTQAIGVASVFPFINLAMNPSAIQNPGIVNSMYELFGFRNENSFVVFLGVMVILFLAFSSIVGIITSWLQARFVAYKNHSLSTRLLEIYLYKPYSFYLQKNTSELSKNVLAEISELSNGFIMAIFDIVINGLIFIVLLATLIIVDPIVTFYVFIMLFVVYGTLNILTRRKLKLLGKLRIKSNKERYKLANEALSSIKISKVMSIEQFFIRNYSKASKRLAKTRVVSSLIGQFPKHALDFLAFGGIILFILLNLQTNEDISNMIPLISVFALAGYRMKPAINHLYLASSHLYYNQAVLDKIHYDMVVDSTFKKEQTVVKGNLKLQNQIKLVNLSFTYSDGKDSVLNNISLTLEKNKMIGFVGITGSGKTTLVDIIMGLHEPTKGGIYIDDTKITRENVKLWQNNIGYVPQEIYLSDDTVAHNIAFGVEDTKIDLDRVRNAAKLAALDDFIMSDLTMQYESVIGERGIRLSGGQRQRIGLARALYRDPEVLVLDEATSALDGATEEGVLHAIQTAAKSRTVIMIAHRLNTLIECDCIYLLDKGNIVASGTYHELISNNKEFMKMARLTDVE